LCAAAGLGRAGLAEGVPLGAQLGVQIKGVLVTVVYTTIGTYLILKVVDVLVGGLRITAEDETVGLDLAEHNERGYNF
jgi:Amt family ammonium transporter